VISLIAVDTAGGRRPSRSGLLMDANSVSSQLDASPVPRTVYFDNALASSARAPASIPAKP
jgi:hypothetical protein